MLLTQPEGVTFLTHVCGTFLTHSEQTEITIHSEQTEITALQKLMEILTGVGDVAFLTQVDNGFLT